MANVQIYPNKNFCYPNEIFSKRLFELTDDDYIKALNERTTLKVTDTDAYEYLKYNNGNAYKLASTILPCKYVSETTTASKPQSFPLTESRRLCHFALSKVPRPFFGRYGKKKPRPISRL